MCATSRSRFCLASLLLNQRAVYNSDMTGGWCAHCTNSARRMRYMFCFTWNSFEVQGAHLCLWPACTVRLLVRSLPVNNMQEHGCTTAAQQGWSTSALLTPPPPPYYQGRRQMPGACCSTVAAARCASCRAGRCTALRHLGQAKGPARLELRQKVSRHVGAGCGLLAQHSVEV